MVALVATKPGRGGPPGRGAWWRGLETWVWYGRWLPCAHLGQRLRLYGPPLPAHPEAERWELFCPWCGLTLQRATWAEWEATVARLPWWGRAFRLFHPPQERP